MPLPIKVGNYDLKNKKFYVTDKVTNEAEVKALVAKVRESMLKDNKLKLVYILSGTHGTSEGKLVRERKFFWHEDKTLETQYFKAVDVFNFTKGAGDDVQISANSWNRYLGAKGVIILAWCFSEQSFGGWMKDNGLKLSA